MKKLDLLAATLLLVGGLNWGLVAIAEFDLVACDLRPGVRRDERREPHRLRPRRARRRLRRRLAGHSRNALQPAGPLRHALPTNRTHRRTEGIQHMRTHPHDSGAARRLGRSRDGSSPPRHGARGSRAGAGHRRHRRRRRRVHDAGQAAQASRPGRHAHRAPGRSPVFAPTDEAFAKVPKRKLKALKRSPRKLKAVLLYHVAAGRLEAADVVERKRIKTLNGKRVRVRVRDSKVFLNRARVTTPDVHGVERRDPRHQPRAHPRRALRNGRAPGTAHSGAGPASCMMAA